MANAGAIDTVLVPGCLALSSVSRNSGTFVNKTGYHNSRNNLLQDHPDDYSVQLPIDRQGPGDKGSAFDWSFDDARLRSDFRTIAKFSKRLYEAGENKDPRTYPLREFYGNTDGDRDVEGWSYYRNGPRSSDKSHLWHIHFSVWRKYINDAAAMRSILSILKGEDMPLSDSDLAKIKAMIPTANEVADAVLDRDRVPNWIDPEVNPKLQTKNALYEIGKQTKSNS